MSVSDIYKIMGVRGEVIPSDNIKVNCIRNITKVYPDMIKVIVYKKPKLFIESNHVGQKRKISDREQYVPSVSSLNRTKTLVKDLVLCNDFELFCTFTFNPAKVDRFRLFACWQKMSTWLHHQADVSRSAGKIFKYLIIPEEHKKGGWHFHALVSGYCGSLHDSGFQSQSGRTIYNITSFRSGFTTAVEIDSKEAVSTYVTKYITKDFVTTFNQRRFFASYNLSRPKRETNSRLFSETLPIFRKKVFESSEIEEYILPVSTCFPTKKRESSFDLLSAQVRKRQNEVLYK